MIPKDNKSYLGYLIKLVDQYNNTYHRFVFKNVIDADYSDFNEEIETSCKKCIRKTNSWKYKIKEINEETILGSFHE